MTTTSQNQEILHSLKSLDAAQSEKVLDFIRGLLRSHHQERYYQRAKNQAMEEIRQALGQPRTSF